MNTNPLTSDIISNYEWLTEIAPSYLFEPSPLGYPSMWKDRTDYLHFKLTKAQQRLYEDAVRMLLYGSGSIIEVKVILAKITEIIAYQEKHGRDRTKTKAKMDNIFGLALMRCPEVKRWG